MQWTLVGNTPVESAIASEGLSLLPIPMAGCMISFGGYNGRYHNAVHVYRPENYLTAGAAASAPAPAHAQPAATAVAPAKAVQDTSGSAAAAAAAASEQERARAEVEAARREAVAAKEAVSHEMAMMRRQLESAQATAADADRVRGSRQECNDCIACALLGHTEGRGRRLSAPAFCHLPAA